MREELNILLLGGAKRITFSRELEKAAKLRGANARFFSYELSTQVPVAILAEIIIGKRWSDHAIMDDLNAVVKSNNINLMIPFVDGAIEVAARFASEHPGCFVPAGSPESVEAMFDKVKANEVFKKNSLAIPEEYNPENPRFPLIAKPRTGSASRGIKILESSDDLNALPDHERYIIQDYIPEREEYTVDCYVSRSGETMTAVPRLRIEVAGGEVTTTRTFKSDEVESAARDILRKLDLRGAVTIQFIRDLKTGRLLLMEINPRVGGGSTCSIAAGAPIARYMVDEALGLHIEPSNDWSDGVTAVRYSQDTVFDKNGQIIHNS